MEKDALFLPVALVPQQSIFLSSLQSLLPSPDIDTSISSKGTAGYYLH